MMWEACADKIQALGGVIEMGKKVVGCHWDDEAGLWIVTYEDEQKGAIRKCKRSTSSRRRRCGSWRTASRPRSLGQCSAAADALKYRDFLTVMLILKDRKLFDDNWIYIHDPSVKVGRMQNFKSWSPEMVPDPSMSCYGLEYFCFEGDGLWSSTDEELIEQAKQELAKIGLAKPEDVLDGCVVRQPKAYPVYDDDYAAHVATIRTELEATYPDAAPGRPQRHAQVQQPGPRHDDGDAVRAEHPGGAQGVRPVAGEPGRRVSRSGRRSRAARSRCHGFASGADARSGTRAGNEQIVGKASFFG